MNGFRKLKNKLQSMGWYVGWNEPCCQSCAWSCLPLEHEEGPFAGKDIDLDKVLFNHSQDCEVERDWVTCPDCNGTGGIDDDYCEHCEGEGEVTDDSGYLDKYDSSVDGFVCFYPEQQTNSMFCFSGVEKGVNNLKEILPIIEECDCTWNWSKTGDQRISISWSNK